MSRHLDLVRSFLEQLEARDHREGAILAREFSVSDTPAIKLRSQAVPTAVHLCNGKALPASLGSWDGLLSPPLWFPLPAPLSGSHSLSAFLTLPAGARRVKYTAVGEERDTLASASRSRSDPSP